MGRFHGKRGRCYFAVASGAAASPLPFIAKWAINFPTDRAEVTAMGDTHKIYANGIADCTGTLSGWLDDATAQTYTAAIDGVARAFYLYPDLSTNTHYFWGTVAADFSTEGGVDGGATLSVSWGAASTITRQGV